MSVDEQLRLSDARGDGRVIDTQNPGVHAKIDATPLSWSLTQFGLGLTCAAIWLSLLVATNFSAVVVALGFLVSLAILN